MTQHHPNFFLVGVVKGGTTSLHYYMGQHPQIYMSPVKETNFFSRLDIDPSLFSRAYAHDVRVDLDSYLASGMKETIHIAHVTDEAEYLKLFSNVRGEKAIGEASNSYLLYTQAPELIRNTYPEAKIIAMLRNPVERAYSQYIMNIRLGKTLETDFIREVREDDEREVRGWGANHQYLYIGRYYEQVRRYLEIFPRDQVLICWYDEYREDPQSVLQTVYRFLGVDPDFVPDTDEKLNIAGVPRFGRLNYWINQTGIVSWAKRILPRSWRGPFKKWMYSESSSDIPKMTDDERQWLIDYYREDVLKLSELLGKDLSHWLA
jgi:hypothetical protein